MGLKLNPAQSAIHRRAQQGAAMTTLYFHPFASYCQKALVALYELGVAFDPRLIDLGDPADRAALAAIWPMMKFPVLHDAASGLTLPEATIIIEHVAATTPGGERLVPADPSLARDVRLWDRIFDNYVQGPMQRIVGERLRPADAKDPHGLAEAKVQLARGCSLVEARIAGREWIVGEGFTMADCAAAPALFYANLVMPLASGYPATSAYLDRLCSRPSFSRVIEEAAPYRHFFPQE